MGSNNAKISTSEFYKLVTKGSPADISYVVLDVRMPSETQQSNIEKLMGSSNKLKILYTEVGALTGLNASKISQIGIDKEKDTVLTFCRSGARSSTAQSHLLAQGYKAINVEGGIMAFSSYHSSAGDL